MPDTAFHMLHRRSWQFLSPRLTCQSLKRLAQDFSRWYSLKLDYQDCSLEHKVQERRANPNAGDRSGTQNPQESANADLGDSTDALNAQNSAKGDPGDSSGALNAQDSANADPGDSTGALNAQDSANEDLGDSPGALNAQDSANADPGDSTGALNPLDSRTSPTARDSWVNTGSAESWAVPRAQDFWIASLLNQNVQKVQRKGPYWCKRVGWTADRTYTIANH